MFERIGETIENSNVLKDVSRNKESPVKGVIYFHLITDDTFEEQLKYFQPENSAIVVEDGDIVEFDVRLGRWSEENRETTMEYIRNAVAKSRRRHYIPPVRVDSGGSHGFVPHVRMINSRVIVEHFVEFLETLTSELQKMEFFSE